LLRYLNSDTKVCRGVNLKFHAFWNLSLYSVIVQLLLKVTLVRSMSWRDNIKMDLMEMGFEA
jgi:hypothetical protein